MNDRRRQGGPQRPPASSPPLALLSQWEERDWIDQLLGILSSQGQELLIEYWQLMRLEAMSYLWRHGASDAKILGDPEQIPAVTELLQEWSPLQAVYLTPTGGVYRDTLQAVLMLYLFFENEALEITDDFSVVRADDRFHRWHHQLFSAADNGRTPLDLLHEDATRISRDLSFRKFFGEDYASRFTDLAAHLQSHLATGRASSEEQRLAAALSRLIDMEEPRLANAT